MVSYSDVLNNLKTLLDKFYVRKQKNDYNLNGVVVTNSNREITTVQSLSANSTMISGLSTVATTGNYADLNSIPSTFSPSTHTHSSNDVTGLTASKNVVTNSSGKLTTEDKPTIPSASSTATDIKMNGTQSAGSLSTFAKADHIHPSDTSKVNVTQATANMNLVTGSDKKVTLEAKNNHSHGEISSDGKVTTTTSTVGNVVVTDGSGIVKVINKLPSANVTHQDISGKLTINQGSSAKNSFVYTDNTGYIGTKTQVGNLKIDGAIGTTSGNIITTTTNGVLQSSSSINSSKVTDDDANTYSNLGSLHSGVSQRVINSAINTKMGKIGEWKDIIDDVIDWDNTTTIGVYCHCWYNESLQMILFRFHYPFLSMQSATKYTWDGQGNTIGKIKVKDEYKPLSLIYGSAVASRGDDVGLGSIWITSNGYFGGVFNKTFANTGTYVQVYGSIIWVLTDDVVMI